MIQSDVQTLRDLFTDRINYAIPIYQRSYVWNEEDHWTPLWEDVASIAERLIENNQRPTAHFLGAIVIEKIDDSPGRVRQYTVIDGQQRLTTLQLLLAAFRRVASERDADSTSGVDVLLKNTGRHVDGFLAYKIRPSRQDQVGFRDVVDSETNSVEPAQTSPLIEAYNFFCRKIDAWLGGLQPGDEDDSSRSEALQDVLDGLLQLVSIQLDGTTDAQVVFETLNSRGADLTSLDLVKNSMLSSAARIGLDVAALYDRHWQPTFDHDRYWLESIRQGRYTRERADLFLMHWLTMKLGRPPRSQHLFADFRGRVLAAGEGAPVAVGDAVREICSDGRTMRSFDSLEPESVGGRFFARLNQMDTTTLLPVALLLYRTSELTSVRRDRALSALESWLVRRMLLGSTTQHYNRLLGRLLESLNTSEDLRTADDTIVRTLKAYDRPTDRWPEDAEIRGRLVDKELYGVLNAKRVRMLFAACEYSLAEEASAEGLSVPEGLTIGSSPGRWCSAVGRVILLVG